MIEALDGPAKSGKLSAVGTVTPVEVKVGASVFDGRKVITLQNSREDTNRGRFYVYFADEGETPNASTVADNGLLQERNVKETYEAGPEQAVFVLAVSGTVDIRITERG
jgi:hypothetical protein